MTTHPRRMAAGCLAVTALLAPITILGAAPAAATTEAFLSSAVAADDEGMSGMTHPAPLPAGTATHDHAATPVPTAVAPSPSEAPMHDMQPVTGLSGASDMAGAHHAEASPMPGPTDEVTPSIAPDAHDAGHEESDEMTDTTSDDSSGHGGGHQTVTAPPDGQRKVVLAGFAAVNMLVFAGAGIMRRRGHGSRSRHRSKQGPTTSARRTGTTTKDTGDQA